MAQVVKRNVTTPLQPSSEQQQQQQQQQQLFNVSSDGVVPSRQEGYSKSTLIVVLVLSVAAILVIGELLMLVREQGTTFEKAVKEVERLHHSHEGSSVVASSSSSDSSSPSFALLDNDSELMRLVKSTLIEYGYKQVHPWEDHIGQWELLWCWRDPYHRSKRFTRVEPRLLRDGQMVNRFPGATFTTKATLVTEFRRSYVPRAYLYPQERYKWEKYMRKHPDGTWVRKNADHRGVVITNLHEAREHVGKEHSEEFFVQRFVEPPHLIEGRKWDIGVYVLLTSLKPLRVYVYDDLLLRFCKEDWPSKLKPQDTDTYVIGDDYVSPWDFKRFQKYKEHDGQHVKLWMNNYFKQQKHPLDWVKKLHSTASKVVTSIIGQDLERMVDHADRWPNKQGQFFELFRFDFVFDDQMNAFLMEVNMSPNLNPSAHPPLEDMFRRILRDIVRIKGFDKGKARRTMVIDEKYEQENAGGWLKLDTSKLETKKPKNEDEDD